MLTVAATCRIGFHSNRMGSSIYQSLSKVIKKTLNFYIPVQVFSGRYTTGRTGCVYSGSLDASNIAFYTNVAFVPAERSRSRYR